MFLYSNPPTATSRTLDAIHDPQAIFRTSGNKDDATIHSQTLVDVGPTYAGPEDTGDTVRDRGSFGGSFGSSLVGGTSNTNTETADKPVRKKVYIDALRDTNAMIQSINSDQTTKIVIAITNTEARVPLHFSWFITARRLMVSVRHELFFRGS